MRLTSWPKRFITRRFISISISVLHPVPLYCCSYKKPTAIKQSSLCVVLSDLSKLIVQIFKQMYRSQDNKKLHAFYQALAITCVSALESSLKPASMWQNT